MVGNAFGRIMALGLHKAWQSVFLGGRRNATVVRHARVARRFDVRRVRARPTYLARHSFPDDIGIGGMKAPRIGAGGPHHEGAPVGLRHRLRVESFICVSREERACLGS